uniref:Pancreatic lipase-related protein 1 n=1 Tax=Magallana gigas TaxID=29159 RepID=K1RB01_MAGGI
MRTAVEPFFFLLCRLILLIFAPTFASVERRSLACYVPYGCFYSDGHIKTPQSPSLINTRFRLFQRIQVSQVAETGGTPLASDLDAFTGFVNATKKTKVIVHGFLDNGHDNWVTYAKDELLVKGDFNIIIVDWGTGAQWPYEQAAGNVFLVGAELSHLLKHLHDHGGVNYADVHIIGHSLGAHIAGLAGHPLTSIGRITGTPLASDLDAFTGFVNATKKTKVIVHGFLDNGHDNWVTYAKDELLVKGDFNIIIVDWGTGAQWPYEQAAGNVFLVGAELSHLLKHLHDHGGVNYADVHIIGHSLGAHIAGLAGHPLTSIGRITGLDPADPLFTGKPINRRLNRDDATFVDVIHTDATEFAVTKGRSVSTSLSCSHSRAHDYFIESINSPCKFFAHQCSSKSDFENGKCLSCPAGGCGVMGYDADATTARGALYLSTSYHSPYCGKNVACVHKEVSKIGTRVCFLNNLL